MFLARRSLNPKLFSRCFCSHIKVPEIKGNHYELLGVKQDANKEEIIQKYKDLARKYHPDICHGSEEYFSHLTDAYQTLIDEEKRVQYDNDTLYTDEYFKTNIFGIKFDWRNAFWTGIGAFLTYQGYRYYDKYYRPKCPLTEEEQKRTLQMENKENIETQKRSS